MGWKRLYSFAGRQLQKFNPALVRNLMHLRSQDELLSHSERPTVVFSPHQDDEVLGCGGMIIHKRRLGATVYIVFMTDGRASHKSRFITPTELADLRKTEAQKCARVMGVPEENLIFLGFEDRFLCHHEIEAQMPVRQILQAISPSEVFVPFRREAPADHHATYRIVRDALRELDGSDLPAVDLYEYFVWTPRLWFWKIRELYESDAWCRINVREAQFLKKNALECYRSQMTALFPDPNWATLPNDLRTWCSRPYEYYLRNLKAKNHANTTETNESRPGSTAAGHDFSAHAKLDRRLDV